MPRKAYLRYGVLVTVPSRAKRFYDDGAQGHRTDECLAEMRFVDVKRNVQSFVFVMRRRRINNADEMERRGRNKYLGVN